jgi:hypothetical protein
MSGKSIDLSRSFVIEAPEPYGPDNCRKILWDMTAIREWMQESFGVRTQAEYLSMLRFYGEHHTPMEVVKFTSVSDAARVSTVFTQIGILIVKNNDHHYEFSSWPHFKLTI